MAPSGSASFASSLLLSALVRTLDKLNGGKRVVGGGGSDAGAVEVKEATDERPDALTGRLPKVRGVRVVDGARLSPGESSALLAVAGL